MPDPLTFGGLAGLAKLVFSFRQGDIKFCNSRIVRLDRGMPWDMRASIHPLENGQLIITPLKSPKPPSTPQR